MTTYETLLITPPNLSEEEERSTIETLAGIVSEGGGTMLAHDRVGRRRLAYPIHKFDDGVYTRFLYDAIPAVPKELERRVRLHDNVLRSLTVALHREWAADAKEQAVLEARRRAEAEAEAAREAAREAEAAAAAPQQGDSDDAGDDASEAAPAPAAESTDEPATRSEG